MNYKTQDFAAEVKNVTGGKGADVVIDFVGQSHWDKNIDVLAVDGTMIMLALMSGMTAPGLFHQGNTDLEFCLPHRRHTAFRQPGSHLVQAPTYPRFNPSLPYSSLPSRPHQEVSFLIISVLCLFRVLMTLARFAHEVLQLITGSNGGGPVRTYIHKVSQSTRPLSGFPSLVM